MNKKFLATMILCAALPLSLAFWLIYTTISSAEVKRVTGSLLQESSRISEDISSAAYRALAAQDALARIVASGTGEAELARVLGPAAAEGDYDALCFMAKDRSLRACGGAAAKDAKRAAALKRCAVGLDLLHGGPWRFFDFGEGPAPVLISRVDGRDGKAAGYLLGALKRSVVTAGLASFKSYYLNLRAVRLEYAAAFHSPYGFGYIERTPGFSMPVEVLEKRPQGSYVRDGLATFWSYTSHAPGVRTCLQVPVASLYAGLREVRAIYFSFAALLVLFLVMLMVYIMRRSLRPLDALLVKLEEMSAGNYTRIDAARFPGDRNVEHANLLIDRMQEYEEKSRREARLTALGKLAAQVAHDIRSPLAALKTALKDILGSLPQERRALAAGAMARISDIAGELIESYRKPWITGRKSSPQDLGPLLAALAAEKRAQHGSSGITLELSGETGERALVEPADFSRVVSNLLNNAVEALPPGGGTVKMELSGGGGSVTVRVSDNGKGISPELLPLLGRKEVTHGKAGGTGMGLYHARQAVEGWGGTLKIKSEPGKGTQVTVELPACAAPAAGPVFLLDDDELVHMNWRLAAKAAGADLRAYTDPAAFRAALEGLPPGTPLYVDSELGAGVAGEEIVKELRAKGFTDITIATGRSPDEFADIPWLKVAGKEPPWN